MPLKAEPTLKAKTTINSRPILRSRRYREGTRPLSKIPLSASLHELARKIWFSDEPITSSDDVYNLYTGMMESSLYPTEMKMHLIIFLTY